MDSRVGVKKGLYDPLPSKTPLQMLPWTQSRLSGQQGEAW